jgi:hypothetical protein
MNQRKNYEKKTHPYPEWERRRGQKLLCRPFRAVEGLQRSRVTPTVARNHEDFYLMDRQRLVMWQRRFYEQLDSVKELLLPEPAGNGKATRAAT